MKVGPWLTGNVPGQAASKPEAHVFGRSIGCGVGESGNRPSG